MKKSTLILSLLLWILFSSFYPIANKPEGELVVPQKKINKTLTKLWKDFSVVLKEADWGTAGICPGNSRLFTVQNQSRVMGFVHVGRVNSCRSGGCSLDAGDAAVEFEYFDYYFVTDTTGSVLSVKVYNYRATHGHEIMSRGWLRQYVGYSGAEELLYGKDIEAISGATVSANAINTDIQMEIACLQQYLRKEPNNLQNDQVHHFDN